MTRGKAERTIEIENAIIRLLDNDAPMTCRQVFYRLVVLGLIEKTEKSYGISNRILRDLRWSERIDMDAIVDEGRSVHVPYTNRDIADALLDTTNQYRLSAMRELSDTHIQIWVEKNALAAIVRDVARPWDVPIVSCVGTPSYSLAWEAASHMESDKPSVVYILSDYDPTGATVIPNTIVEHLTHMCDLQGIATPSFERLALTREQVERWDLPTRPTKDSTHSKKFDDDRSVELDALSRQQLSDLITDALSRHIDPMDIKELREREDREREKLRRLAYKIEAEGLPDDEQ